MNTKQSIKSLSITFIFLFTIIKAHSQDSIPRFVCHFQLTTVDQSHGRFNSPYVGTASLQPNPEEDLSLTSTMFTITRLWKNGYFFFNPEISGGKAFSGASGIAGFPNGEIYRVGNPAPQAYIARAYLQQIIPLPGYKYEHLSFTDSITPLTDNEDMVNQLPKNIQDKRLVFIIGKYCLADFFDENIYSHDPRHTFLNWALMDNGAWDYPANTRGYTYSALAEYDNKGFAIRMSAALEPTYANGPIMDWNINKTIGYTLEADRHFEINNHEGEIGFLLYENIGRGGNYEQAIALKKSGQDTTMNVSHPSAYLGNKKYGLGFSFTLALTKKLDILARAGWNDGHTATWAFTEIDRTAALGILIDQPLLKKTRNTFGLAILVNGISPEHRDFLNNGGVDFIIGDGKLPHYATENILETYYNVAVTRNIALMIDFQYVQNPGYNVDRGPVPYIISGRIHMAF
jgi:high affinity Mn2+ porin